MDDTLLQLQIDGAEDEAKQYLDRNELPRRDDKFRDWTQSDSTLNAASDVDDLAPTVRMGIFLLVQALYEVDDPDEMEKMRSVAFTLMRPYRDKWGV